MAANHRLARRAATTRRDRAGRYGNGPRRTEGVRRSQQAETNGAMLHPWQRFFSRLGTLITDSGQASSAQPATERPKQTGSREPEPILSLLSPGAAAQIIARNPPCRLNRSVGHRGRGGELNCGYGVSACSACAIYSDQSSTEKRIPKTSPCPFRLRAGPSQRTAYLVYSVHMYILRTCILCCMGSQSDMVFQNHVALSLRVQRSPVHSVLRFQKCQREKRRGGKAIPRAMYVPKYTSRLGEGE